MSFNDFISESRKVTKAHLDKEVTAVVQEFAWSGLISTGYLTPAESKWLVENSQGFTRLDETLLGQLRDKVKSVKDTEMGQKIYAKLSKVYDRGITFAKYLVSLFQKVFDRVLGYFMKKFDPVKKGIVNDIKSGKKSIPKMSGNLKTDTKNLTDTISFWLKNFQQMYQKGLQDTFSKEIIKEALHNDARIIDSLNNFVINEDEDGGTEQSLIDDSTAVIGVIDKMAHKIAKIPPFNLLDKVKDLASKSSSRLLEEFSIITHKMGGPGVFKFEAIGVVIGFFVEWYAHHLADRGIESVLEKEIVLRFLPFAGGLITAISIVAMCISVVEVVKELNHLDMQVPGENAGAAPAAPVAT